MKKLYTLLLLIAMALGAVAQEDCPLPEAKKLSAKERQEWNEFLKAILQDWKRIGASGNNPAISFEDLDKSRILISSTYNLDDSSLVEAESYAYDYVRVMTLYDILARLKIPIFETVAELGYDVVVKVNYRPDLPQRIFVYDNATLNRFLELENLSSAMIYADAIIHQKETPFELDDSILCTGVSYCNHLWTAHLHSLIKMDSDTDPRFEWMMYLGNEVIGSELLNIVGMDGTTARFVVLQDGTDDTMVFEYTPAQLRGEEPSIDIDRVGVAIAQIIDKTFPMPLDNGMGTMEKCSYEPLLHVLTVDCLVDELTILSNQGKEEMIKRPILELIFGDTDGKEFLEGLVEVGLGLEYHMQSRTTRRPLTITYTPDELRVYVLDKQ